MAKQWYECGEELSSWTRSLASLIGQGLTILLCAPLERARTASFDAHLQHGVSSVF